MRFSALSAPAVLLVALSTACADDGVDGRPPGAEGGSGTSAGGSAAGAGGSGGSTAGVGGTGNASQGGSGGSSGPNAGAGGTMAPSAGTGGTTSPSAGTGGTTSPSAGTGGMSSSNGGTGGASPPNGGSAGAPSPTAGSGGGSGAGGGAGGVKACVGEVDDTEPNDSLATAYDLGTLKPELDDDCGGTTPQISFDGSIGPGDVDYAKVNGAEKKVKCSHRPQLLVFGKTNANGCLVAKCDDGDASYTCKGGFNVDLGNGYYGCCGDLSKDTAVLLEGFTCSGSKGSAKLLVKISPLANATTCEPYGVLVRF